jgi:hypothetical protein
VVGSLDGFSAPSLTEGAAEALGHGVPLVADVSTTTPSLLVDFALGNAEYPRVGAITRFLIERHDKDAFRAFYRAMIPSDARELADYERAFEASFGEPLDEAWADLVQENRCGYPLPFCDAVPASELPPSAEPFACEEPGVLGYEGPDAPDFIKGFAPYRLLQFHLDAPQRVRFEIDHLELDFAYCGPCSFYSAPTNLRREGATMPNDGPLAFDLPAGDFVIILRPKGDGPLRLLVTPVEG